MGALEAALGGGGGGGAQSDERRRAQAVVKQVAEALEAGSHSLTSKLNLRTFGSTSLTLELNLSTFRAHPWVNLGHMADMGDKVSFS
jgi:hypothetical protein